MCCTAVKTPFHMFSCSHMCTLSISEWPLGSRGKASYGGGAKVPWNLHFELWQIYQNLQNLHIVTLFLPSFPPLFLFNFPFLFPSVSVGGGCPAFPVMLPLILQICTKYIKLSTVCHFGEKNLKTDIKLSVFHVLFQNKVQRHLNIWILSRICWFCIYV